MQLATAGAAPAPSCPGELDEPWPSYGPVDAPPEVAVWFDLAGLPDSCLTVLDRTAPLTVALAGRFTHSGPIDELAARIGAISKTVGLPYRSVTGDEWRPLVSEAVALGSVEATDERPDFAAAEILAGDALYFARNDSRSRGTNVYRLRTLDASLDRLVVETDDVSGIELGPVTLFPPEAVTSIAFIRRLEGSTWEYFGLSVIRESAFAAREKSVIDRQAALYRLLIGEAPDREPPLAP